MNYGRVSVGQAMCRVTIRENVVRYCKCLEHGRRTVECEGPDRSENCFKCSLEGHRANECETTPNCVNYKKEGHRVGAISCPAFRMHVKENRDKRARYMKER